MYINRVLITGGLGFIGGAVIRNLLLNSSIKVFNLDKVSYASDFKSIEKTILNNKIDRSRYQFFKCDLADSVTVSRAIKISNPDIIIHLAAETHVDNSIKNPYEFVESNIIGTFNLLNHALIHYEKLSEERKKFFRFHHVSTDEVFGSLGNKGLFSEKSQYDPRSPYSASKASSDHLVNSWWHTYGLPVIITNCSNNFGPWQFPEKLIPVTIINGLRGKSIPVYGQGTNIRDWLYVDDHADAILRVCFNANAGGKFCIGGNSELRNIDLVKKICKHLDELKPRSRKYESLINYVEDRPGHDKRYAMDSSKILKELNWKPIFTFKERLLFTIKWYLNNEDWYKLKI